MWAGVGGTEQPGGTQEQGLGACVQDRGQKLEWLQVVTMM